MIAGALLARERPVPLTGYTLAVETGKRLKQSDARHELLRFVAKDIRDERGRLILPRMSAEEAHQLDQERLQRFTSSKRQEELRIANKQGPSQAVLDEESFTAISLAMEHVILLIEGVVITFEHVPAKSMNDTDTYTVRLAGLESAFRLPEVFENRQKAELYLQGVKDALHASGISCRIRQNL